MKTLRLSFYMMQVIASMMVILFWGICPLFRCFLNHSDNFCKICFTVLIFVGVALLRLSIAELREALK